MTLVEEREQQEAEPEAEGAQEESQPTLVGTDLSPVALCFGGVPATVVLGDLHGAKRAMFSVHGDTIVTFRALSTLRVDGLYRSDRIRTTATAAAKGTT